MIRFTLAVVLLFLFVWLWLIQPAAYWLFGDRFGGFAVWLIAGVFLIWLAGYWAAVW